METGQVRALKEVVITPPKQINTLDWRECWQYRHMFWSLVRRNLKAEFDEMFFGVLWSFSRPLLMVTLFVLFKNYSNAQLNVTIPYPIYVYSGLIVWFYFAETVSAVSNCIKSDSSLISKIYYPRIISPAVPVVANLAEIGIATVPLIGMMIYYKMLPGIALLLLPVVLFHCMILIMGVGCIFAALSLIHRDFERFLNLVLYIGLFASPTIYAPDMVHGEAPLIHYFNPMAGVLMAMRGCLFSNFDFWWGMWLGSLAMSIVLFFVGVYAYRKAESMFVEKM